MIESLWLNTATPPQGVGSQLLIVNDNAEMGILHQAVDLGLVQNLGSQACLELEVLTNGTAPGANTTLTAWMAFCSLENKVPIELSTAALSQVLNLANLPTVRRIYLCPLLFMGARYFHLWFDHTALAAGSTLEITARVNGVKSR